MKKRLRVMSERPLNAETPVESLRSWITDNRMFFKRNQGQIMDEPVDIDSWALTVGGLVERPLKLSFADLLGMEKTEVANTLECSGNGRALLSKKASGNPWTIGGVGNAVWGGVMLSQVLEKANVKADALHVSFEGLDEPLGSAGIRFIRSIPLEKALSSTLLAYEMNGQALPLAHGYPLRALALGWTGANCVKWLSRVTLLDKPFAGFFMDKVYRVFQEGEEPSSGDIVTAVALKSIITEPLNGDSLARSTVAIRGAAYAGEAQVEKVAVSVDGGRSWHSAGFVGPNEPYAWRRWQYLWHPQAAGEYTIMSRASDSCGNAQPQTAAWNKLGYGNNGVSEHAISVNIGR